MQGANTRELFAQPADLQKRCAGFGHLILFAEFGHFLLLRPELVNVVLGDDEEGNFMEHGLRLFAVENVLKHFHGFIAVFPRLLADCAMGVAILDGLKQCVLLIKTADLDFAGLVRFLDGIDAGWGL